MSATDATFGRAADRHTQHMAFRPPQTDIALAAADLERWRKRLLDLGRRNGLIHLRLDGRGGGLRFTGPSLREAFEELAAGRAMPLAEVPDPPEEVLPPEEQTPEFTGRLEELKASSAEWQEGLARAAEDPAAEAELARIEAALRAQVRRELGLPPRSVSKSVHPVAVAEGLGLPTSCTLPLEPQMGSEHRGGSGGDGAGSPALQTLLFRKDLHVRAEALRRKARSAREERGVEILKLVFGLLHWTETDERRERNTSPLLVLPVALERRADPRTRGPLYLPTAEGEQLERNETLSERLRQDFGLELPSLEAEAEDRWSAVARFFMETERLAAGRKGWSVQPSLTLAPLSPTRFAIWRDLDPAQWPGGEPAAHPLVFPLLRGADGPDEVARAPEIDVEDRTKAALTPFLITDADSSQHAAIIDAMEGRSFVLEGPPGTGKSQTIVNLIANAIGTGKRVLFVAEKRAALEVVLNRLAECGLDLFALPLHGSEAQPKAVIDRIRRRLSRCEKSDTAHADALKASEAAAVLRRYVDAAKEPVGPRGECFVDLVGQSLLNRPEPAERDAFNVVLRRFRGEIDGDALAEAESLVDGIARAAASLAALGIAVHASPFRDLHLAEASADAAEMLVGRLRELQEAARVAADAADRLAAVLGCAPKPTPKEAEDLCRRLGMVGAKPTWPPSLAADRFIDFAAVRRAGELVERARAGRAARAFLGERGVPQSIDQAAFSAFVDLVGQAELPPEACIADLEPLTQAARDEAETLRDAVDLLRTEVASPLGVDDGGLSRRDAALLIGLAELAARLPEASISWRRAGIERDAEALREASTAHAALIARFDRLASLLDVELLLVLDRESLARATRVFSSWSMLTGVTSRGREARRVLRKLWIGARRLPEPRRAAQLLSDAQAALAETRELAGRDVIRRHCENAADPRRLPIAALAEAACWQAALAEAERAGVPRSLLRRLVELPEETFRCLAAAAPRLAVLGEGLDRSQGATALNELIELAAVRAERVERVRRSARALGLPLDLAIGEASRVAEALEWRDAEREACADPLWSELFGSGEPPTEAALRQAEQAVEYARKVHETVPEAADGILSADAARLAEVETATRCVLSALDRLGKAGAALRETGAEALEPDEAEPFGSVLQRTDELIAQRALIVPTMIWRERLEAARDHPLAGPLAEAAETGRIAPERLATALAWCVARRAASAQQTAAGQALRLTGDDLAAARTRFCSADRAFLAANAARLREALLDRRPPPGSASGPPAEWTEMTLINHELTKKRRFLPLRRLMDRSFLAVTTLFPCVMMSPLAVAELLPARMDLFDLVIMDEASQVRPEEAFGSLLRGRQAVIVGDPKQLPPTAFFDRLFDGQEDDDEDAIPAAESVLDLATRAFAPNRRLLWHYRSRHQSLIAFSNRHFYDDELVVFPAAAEPGMDLGVELRDVGGFWRGGEGHRVNIEEARAVAAEVAARARRRPDLSMGVVAMNAAQAELIEREIALMAVQDEALRRYLEAWEERESPREPLFVKNLENVQGDERDVVLISLGYGRTPEGALHQRFAPIQRKSDGDRRLNVLFTRARSKVVVFASLQPEDIQAEGKARGVGILRDYLAYAREGGRLPAKSDGTAGAPESPFEEAVRRTLVARGFDVVPQLGVQGYRLDLAVRDPDDRSRYVLGIECDGATYHRARWVRDRDRLRQQNLERLGWRIVRVWSTDWFRDPDGEAERLAAAVRRAIDAARQDRPSRAQPPAVQGAMLATPTRQSAGEPDGALTRAVRLPHAEAQGTTRATVCKDEPDKSALSLDDVLRRFRDDVIGAEMPEADPARGLLREAMLREIVRQGLDDPDDFHRKIPLALRERTDPEQVRRFLEDVCDLVARHREMAPRLH